MTHARTWFVIVIDRTGYYYPKTEAAFGNYRLKSCYQNPRYLFSAITCEPSIRPRFLKFRAGKTSLTYRETKFFYQRLLQPPARLEKPGGLEFLYLSLLVIDRKQRIFASIFAVT
ncbi:MULTISPECIES: hypothetical protein [Microcoleaceae]|uniref:hypothetical protein n=1 Tax=Microcoleaceae TaxID=1892252 RepID=UPI0018809DBF|nr:hypothetical protein [Tychonema sp. LEGE 06208]MBE9164702.1 hypothetical protein [Tychonema sp. LEGE 06208]